jgi:hypothetical protein
MRKSKALILGSSGYQRANEKLQIVSKDWSKINRVKNIRDYDVVVINLLSLENKELVDWEYFDDLITFKNSIDILRNGGVIFIIGDPRFSYKIDDFNEKEFLTWTGINFLWDSEPGDTVHFQDNYQNKNFEEYSGNLRKWTYSLKYCQLKNEVIEENFNKEALTEQRISIQLNRKSIAHNRYNYDLIFSVNLQFERESYGPKNFVESTYGPIYFLPEINLSEDETIQLFLKEILGMEAPLPEPEWIGDYSAPGQGKIDEEIRKIEAEIDNLISRLNDAENRKEKTRECLKLLYERETVLEPVVRNILRQIGLHVEDPTEPNKEDGWISYKDGDKLLEGVIEIKSTRNQHFNEGGRKQLLDWIDRGRTLREKNLKGIFIGSSSVDKPLNERPYAFSDSWIKAAELSDICAIKTEDLYLAYVLISNKKIKARDFIIKLFNTSGIFDASEYYDIARPTDDVT